MLSVGSRLVKLKYIEVNDIDQSLISAPRQVCCVLAEEEGWHSLGRACQYTIICQPVQSRIPSRWADAKPIARVCVHTPKYSQLNTATLSRRDPNNFLRQKLLLLVSRYVSSFAAINLQVLSLTPHTTVCRSSRDVPAYCSLGEFER